MDRKTYAQKLMPSDKTWDYYETLYPKRNLKEGAMVTRFAPSPTGFVHIGSLYASFSVLQMARQSKGVAYLRIEDTDQKREVKDGIEEIIKDFKKLKITWDEGPTQGGDYAPYIQSQREDIYKAYARALVEEDKAYPCFCSDEDLKEMRTEQELQKYRLGYYGKWARCRHLAMDEVLEKIDRGEKYIIRFKSEGDFNNKIILKDAVKGDIEMPENDVDVVILKSDGLPTYHFAHVIDDHLMRTTHVIRGDEWVSSYPIHHQLFDALNFKRPVYAHLAPITVKEGNTVRKLSKRKDKEAAISFYHQEGIPSEVIMLYLATINNYDFETWYLTDPNNKIEDYFFEFSKMPIGGSLFDIEKLYSISKTYFTGLSAKKIYEELLIYTKEYDLEFYNILIKYPDYSVDVLNIERQIEKPRKDISKYKDIRALVHYMYEKLYDDSNYEWQKITDSEEIKKISQIYIDKYYDETDDKENWFNKIKDLSEELSYAREVKEYKKNKEAYKGHVGDVSTVLRVALTSESKTPDLYEIMKLLGKERIKERFKKHQ